MGALEDVPEIVQTERSANPFGQKKHECLEFLDAGDFREIPDVFAGDQGNMIFFPTLIKLFCADMERLGKTADVKKLSGGRLKSFLRLLKREEIPFGMPGVVSVKRESGQVMRMAGIHFEQEVSSDKAVPGMTEIIQPGASDDDEMDGGLPLVIIALKDVFPLGIFVDFIKDDPGTRSLGKTMFLL
jgi:hypothetical protein